MKKITMSDAKKQRRPGRWGVYLQALSGSYAKRHPDCTHALLQSANHPRWSDPWVALVLAGEVKEATLVTNSHLKSFVHGHCAYREGTHVYCTIGNADAAREKPRKVKVSETGYIFDRLWRTPHKNENIYAKP